MPLEGFIPETSAQELTNPHYASLLGQGWPETLVQQGANTIYQYTTLCGQLLQQETGFDLPSAVEGEPGPHIPMSLELAHLVMELFAETITQAFMHSLDLGLPEAARAKILETLAEDVYSYSKQVVASVQGADPPPDRLSLTTWLTQTAHEAVAHYLYQYEQEFGPVPRETITRQIAAPETSLPQEAVPNSTQTTLPPTPPTASPPVSPVSPPLSASPAPVSPAAATPPPAREEARGADQITHRLAAVALLLKSLPADHYSGLLRLFPATVQANIADLAGRDDWLDRIDPIRVNQQLQQLRQLLNQPVTHPEQRLKGLIKAWPWSMVQRCLSMERPIWLRELTALKEGESTQLPLHLLELLLPHLEHQLKQLAKSSAEALH